MKRIYARNCEVVIVSKQTEEQFINENHYQGYIPSKVRYALTDGNQVVEMMTFGVPRYNKAYDWELLRLCTKKDYQVVGGASKLFKAFTDNYKGNIISYCNESKFSGNVYPALGFTKISTCKSYHYEKDGKSYHRSQFQRWRLEKLFPQYPRNKYTEAQIMQLEGYTRVNETQATWVLGEANDKWYIYKITLDDSSTYIGQHRYHNDINDGYNGSGTILKRKQNTHSWIKEILVENITSQEEADMLEKRCVAVDRLENENNINICDGGHGYIGNGVNDNAQYEPSPAQLEYWASLKGKSHIVSEETKLKISLAQKGKPRRKHTDEEKKALSVKMKGRHLGHHTEESHRKQSETLKESYRTGKVTVWNKDSKRAEWLEKFTSITGKSLSTFKRFWSKTKHLSSFEEAFKYYKPL